MSQLLESSEEFSCFLFNSIEAPRINAASFQKPLEPESELVHISSSPFTYFIFSGENEQGKSVVLRP
ncbi:hypothetical protein HMPREF0189_01586 [Burkholderiales bacterium 1_1_47]|nr:hypothetical protein HMPREF0189_01586 [Burkholderiales bacterium 1_1_47]